MHRTNRTPTSEEAEEQVTPLFAMKKTRGRSPEKPWWVQDATRTRFEVVCPGHTHRVGIIEYEGHLRYRLHRAWTYGGFPITCGNSLKPVCELPGPAGRPDVHCAHQAGVPR
jgi:hypothetical protein